jgi:hypothetical protein
VRAGLPPSLPLLLWYITSLLDTCNTSLRLVRLLFPTKFRSALVASNVRVGGGLSCFGVMLFLRDVVVLRISGLVSKVIFALSLVATTTVKTASELVGAQIGGYFFSMIPACLGCYASSDIIFEGTQCVSMIFYRVSWYEG